MGMPPQGWLTNTKWALARRTDLWGDPLENDSMLKYWFGVVENYTKRQLTHASDKLIALLGLQNRIAEILDDEPVAGCWRKQNFWPSLMWTYANEELTPTNVRIQCPSWSWASTDRSISYSELAFSTGVFKPEVRSWNLDIIESSGLIKGSVTIQGMIFRYRDFFVEQGDQLSDSQPPLRKETRRFRQGAFITESQTSLPSPWDATAKLSAISEIYEDATFPADMEKVSFLLVADVPYQPPPQYGYPIWPAGRPPSAILMCLKKTSPDFNNSGFRRIGLAQAWSVKEWRDRGVERTFELS